MRGLQGSPVAVGSAVALVAGVLVVPAATGAAPVKGYSLKAGSYPFAVPVGPQGDAYSANLNGSSISRVSSSGVLSDPWGQVNSPRAMAVDDQGNVYAIAAGNVARFQPDGSAETGWAVLDPMAGATSIAIDVNRNVYTANQSQGSISKITPQGGVTQIWAALGAWPADIAVDGNGNLYTVNSSENSVSRVTPDGTVTTTWAKLAQSASPSAIAVDSANNVYTANVNNRTISRITSAGQVTRSWATLHPDSGPIDIAIDANDNVYTANNNDETVSRVTPTGVVTQSWAVLAEGSTPSGIAVAPDKVYVANAGNDTISEIPLVTSPASPSNVTVGLASASTVEIAWTPPLDTGGAALSGYVVRRYRDGGIAAEAAIPVSPNATNVSEGL